MKILIVEDNVIIAEDIRVGLEAKGYEIIGIAPSYIDAIQFLETGEVAFAVVDIIIEGSFTGIELAKQIREKYNLPFIFLTSHGDSDTIEKALKTEPNGYLMKPFERKELYASIEVALLNFKSSSEKSEAEEVSAEVDAVFIKHKSVFTKVKYENVLYIKADGNYIEIFTEDGKKYLLRMSVKHFIDKTGNNTFFRTNRSHAVNVSKVESVGKNFVTVDELSVPLGKEQRQDLIKMITFLS